MLRTRARDEPRIVAYCNLVGGQDELVFDGRSVIDADGDVVARAAAFAEELLVCDVDPAPRCTPGCATRGCGAAGRAARCEPPRDVRLRRGGRARSRRAIAPPPARPEAELWGALASACATT